MQVNKHSQCRLITRANAGYKESPVQAYTQPVQALGTAIGRAAKVVIHVVQQHMLKALCTEVLVVNEMLF